MLDVQIPALAPLNNPKASDGGSKTYIYKFTLDKNGQPQLATEFKLISGGDVAIISWDNTKREVTLQVKASASEAGAFSQTLVFQAKVGTLISNDSVKSVQLLATRTYRMKQSLGDAEDWAGQINFSLTGAFAVAVNETPEFSAEVRGNANFQWIKHFGEGLNKYPGTLSLQAAWTQGVDTLPAERNISVAPNLSYGVTYAIELYQNGPLTVTGAANIDKLFSPTANTSSTKEDLSLTLAWQYDKYKISVGGKMNSVYEQSGSQTKASGGPSAFLSVSWKF